MIRSLLYDELWLEICKYCDKGVLVWHFVITNEDSNPIIIHKLINDCFVLHITQDCFDESFKEFNVELKKSSAIIAGSYPISILAGCSPGEINIFVPKQRQLNDIWNSLKTKGYDYYSELMQWFYQWTSSTFEHSYDHDHHIIKNYSIDGDENKKRQFNREASAFKKYFNTNEKDFESLLKEEPLLDLPKKYQKKLPIHIIHTKIVAKHFHRWLHKNLEFKTCWDGDKIVIIGNLNDFLNTLRAIEIQ